MSTKYVQIKPESVRRDPTDARFVINPIEAAVDDDGTVYVWDEISETYTTWHDLSAGELAQARARAGVSR